MYEVEDHGDHVHLTSKKDREEYWRLSRAQAQAIHEELAVVCAEECDCYYRGEGLKLAKIRAGSDEQGKHNHGKPLSAAQRL